MTWRNIDLIAKARQLESTIARRVDRAARDLVRSHPREPLEIVYAIVERVEEHIEPGGRGARVFPFTHIAVSVVAPSSETRARFEVVFDNPPTLRERIAERLAAAGCRHGPPYVCVTYVTRAHKNWRQPAFDVRFSREPEPAATAHAGAAKDGRIELTVARGTAERRTYSFTASRIDIGRCSEVRDSRQRLIRANNVVFTEGADPINQTVSRQHAHITFDSQSGAFRVRDDGSAHGTVVVRAGKAFPVPRGARGVRLQAGDEIALGAARIRVRVP